MQANLIRTAIAAALMLCLSGSLAIGQSGKMHPKGVPCGHGLTGDGLMINACQPSEYYCPVRINGTFDAVCLKETAAEKAARERQQAANAEFLRQRKARVDALVARLGEHRRAEAEQMIRMEDAAAGSRPVAVAATAPKAPPKCVTTRKIERRTATFSTVVTGKDYQEVAKQDARAFVQGKCKGATLVSSPCTGGGMIGSYTCKLAYDCPVETTRCEGTGQATAPQ